MAVLAYFVILGLAEGIWVARIPAVKAGLHLTDGLLGASLLAGPGALVLVMPLAGRLADRFGGARLTRLAGLAVAILPLALWTARTLAAVIAALLAFGITGGHAGGGRERAGCPGGAGHRPAADGLVYASYSLGGLAGAVLGGLLRLAGRAGGRGGSAVAGSHRPGAGVAIGARRPAAACCPRRPGCARAGPGGRGPASWPGGRWPGGGPRRLGGTRACWRCAA